MKVITPAMLNRFWKNGILAELAKKADKKEIENIKAGIADVDSVLNSTSKNPVQNKVVKAALDECAKIGGIGYSDVNNLVNEGMYIAYRCSNMPGNLEYCGVIVAKAGTTLNDTQIRQIAFNSNGYDIYTRYTSDYTDGDHAWSEWKKMLTAEDISQSTAITTAGKYALDAVQNNASVSGTLANRTKKLEDTIGKVYSNTATVSGKGEWSTGCSVTIPAGTYIITRKGVNTSGSGVSIGCGYNALSFVTTPTDASTGIYTEIKEFTSAPNTINVYYCAGTGTNNIKLEIKAVRIK